VTPVTVAPLFLLYDYSFLPENAPTKKEALAYAYRTGVVCADEAMLHPDPYESREAWCRARIEETERRLAQRSEDVGGLRHNGAQGRLDSGQGRLILWRRG